MQALDERKTGGRWKVAYLDPQQVSEPAHTYIIREAFEKQIEQETKTEEEKQAVIQKLHAARQHEVTVYIAKIMKKRMKQKSHIMCAYNFK